MLLTEEDLEFDWKSWGSNKPWYCPVCDTLLSSDYYEKCDGTDPTVLKKFWNKHKEVKKGKPVTFNEFCRILKDWEKQREGQEGV